MIAGAGLDKGEGKRQFAMKRIARRLGGLALKSGIWLQRRSSSGGLKRANSFSGLGDGTECFIGFFGLNRSLNITWGSICISIAEPLKSVGFRIVSAAHLNSPKMIHSPRSGEVHVVATNLGIENMDCELIWQEPQRADCIEPLASEICANYHMRDEDDEDQIIRRNALLQMYSQSRLLAMLRLIGLDRFKMFCFVRPDLLFLDDIPPQAIKSIIDGTADVITPDWHRWGGLNDRFSLCSRRGAEVYLSRLDWVSSFCAEKGYFHPEEILLYSIERSKLIYDFMHTRARRVRSDGLIRNEDFTLGGLCR
jgi:hypothetical protein